MPSTSPIAAHRRGAPERRRRFLAVALVLAAFSAPWVEVASAQESADARDASSRTWSPSQVYLAIPDDFPPIDARAMVVREPGVDLIVLRDGEVDAGTLSMALHVLRDARRRMPAPTLGTLIPIMGFSVSVEVSARIRARLEEALGRLTRAETVDLGSLGRGRRVTLSPR